jgi:hypothetical protein
MRSLTISTKTFNEMILGLIQSGVTFVSKENSDGTITIEFTGGY